MDQNGETEFQPKDHVTIGIVDTYMGISTLQYEDVL